MGYGFIVPKVQFRATKRSTSNCLGSRHLCALLCRNLHTCRGYSVLDLLAALSTLMVLLAVGAPNISLMASQYNTSADARLVKTALSTARVEAMRTKLPVDVLFQGKSDDSPAEVQLDFDQDGQADKRFILSNNSDWTVYGYPGIPMNITFNGMGLAEGMGSGAYGSEFGIKNKDVQLSLTVYGSGVAHYGTWEDPYT